MRFRYKPREVEVYKWDGNLGHFRKWCDRVGVRNDAPIWGRSWCDEEVLLVDMIIDDMSKSTLRKLAGRFIVYEDEKLSAWSPQEVAAKLEPVEDIPAEVLVEIDECGNVTPVKNEGSAKRASRT